MMMKLHFLSYYIGFHLTDCWLILWIGSVAWLEEVFVIYVFCLHRTESVKYPFTLSDSFFFFYRINGGDRKLQALETWKRRKELKYSEINGNMEGDPLLWYTTYSGMIRNDSLLKWGNWNPNYLYTLMLVPISRSCIRFS